MPHRLRDGEAAGAERERPSVETPHEAEQATTGAGGEDDSLAARYAAAIQAQAVSQWRRPEGISSVVCDIRIPFARPRGRDLGETLEFNAICRTLREHIEAGHRQDRAA